MPEKTNQERFLRVSFEIGLKTVNWFHHKLIRILICLRSIFKTYNIVACKFLCKLLNVIDINFTFMHSLTGQLNDQNVVVQRIHIASTTTPRPQDDRKQEEYIKIDR